FLRIAGGIAIIPVDLLAKYSPASFLHVFRQRLRLQAEKERDLVAQRAVAFLEKRDDPADPVRLLSEAGKRGARLLQLIETGLVQEIRNSEFSLRNTAGNQNCHGLAF